MSDDESTLPDGLIRDEQMAGDVRLDGHRIAVYHIVQYHNAGYSPAEIAAEFGVEVSVVEVALEYAGKHGE